MQSRLQRRARSGRPLAAIASLLCLNLWSLPSGAETMSRLELTDGSILVGEVLGMSDGVYSVRSPTLGTIRVESSPIRDLRRVDTPPGPDPAPVDLGAT